jgi:hypothetical protein
MAKKGFWLGMLVMALIFGLVLPGCKTDDDGNRSSGSTAGLKIEGTNICAVHGVAMEPQKVSIRYGLYLGDFEYETVKEAYFPNCDDPVLGGCLVRAPFVVDKLVCSRCNEARDERQDNLETDW